MMSTTDETELALTIDSRDEVADGVTLLSLTKADGSDLPAWLPGAHIDLTLAPDLTRQYSLCGDPSDSSVWKVAVLYEPEGRGGSRYIHEKLSEGDTVDVRGPRNHFELEVSPRYLFIAGGIGITPIIPMLHLAEKRGASWKLIYGGRTLSSMAFSDDLTAAFGNRVLLHPQDANGLIDLDSDLSTAQPDTLVYTCGPPALLDAVTNICQKYSWPSTALHLERFTPKVIGEAVSDDEFAVELSVSGITLSVTPGQSILEVVVAAGIDVVSSCAEGTCGTCETTVLDGEIDHRDSILSEDEQEANDTMMICVSRAKCQKLTLEL